jgi:hypothetical protein
MTTTNIETVINSLTAIAGDASTPDAVRTWAGEMSDLLRAAEATDRRFIKGQPIPHTVGAMADEYSIVRTERLRLKKAMEAVQSRETEIYNCIMSTLDESADTGASGALYRVQRVEKDRTAVKDWPSLWAYIQANGAFDMLQKRVNDKAVKDLIEDGKTVPGVEITKVPTLSFSKVDS